MQAACTVKAVREWQRSGRLLLSERGYDGRYYEWRLGEWRRRRGGGDRRLCCRVEGRIVQGMQAAGTDKEARRSNTFTGAPAKASLAATEWRNRSGAGGRAEPWRLVREAEEA